jgi:hypothetical protein
MMLDMSDRAIMHAGIWVALGNFVLVFVAVGLGLRRMKAAERATSRSPFSEKLIRPAGESLRLQIEELREKIDEIALTLSLLAIIPLLTAAVVPHQSVGSWIGLGLVTLATWGAAGIWWRRLMKLRRRLRPLKLGFDGERYVGEELNQLMRQGYRVYHDFLVDWKPGERVFNIDHIAVGPEGIFAIETKTRRKPNQEGDGGRQATHTVIQEGGKLKYPGFESDGQLRQAKRAADDLAKWLRGTAAEPVEVVPVIVIPGWWVEVKEKNPAVKVLSGKQARRALPGLGRAGALSEKRVREIGDTIERHCRNVEGA